MVGLLDSGDDEDVFVGSVDGVTVGVIAAVGSWLGLSDGDEDGCSLG